MLLKTLAVGLLISISEVVNGNIRVHLLHRLYGKKLAKTISFFSGITIIFIISWFTLPWVSPGNYSDCYVIGIIWLIMLLSLDIYFGRYVFKFKWIKIANDFNPLKGNLLSVGLVLLFLCPSIVFWFQQ